MDAADAVEITPSHAARVGTATVRRALPQHARRTVGAWCFADHLGPAAVGEGGPGDGPGSIGPHPHIGLQTVTWLVDGRLVHRDSLGSEQEIRPGQLNLMTAGHGVAHAEELLTPAGGRVHGIQLWVALPETTRHGPPAFEHHAELPVVGLGAGQATVLVGALAGATSPARHDTDHVGAELLLRPGRTVVPVDTAHEHALVVLDGAVSLDGARLTPGHLGHLDPGRDELVLEAGEPCRSMLLGGRPFGETVSMWWNFVARSHDEIDAAADAWDRGDDRFGPTGSELARIRAPVPPWRGAGPDGDPVNRG